jgi:purine-binding chemotaxis protein CheW
MARKKTEKRSFQGQQPAASAETAPVPPPAAALAVVDPDLPAAEVTQVLQRRARALAQVPPAEEEGAAVPVVVFALGQETYGVEATFVENIYPLEDLTPVPGTPDFVAGVVNLRGRLLCVVDLHRFLGLEHTAIDEEAQVIAVDAAGLEVGILASEVRAVSTLRLDGLQPALPTTTRVAADYTRGVTADMLVLLDLEVLLSDHRMVVYEEV